MAYHPVVKIKSYKQYALLTFLVVLGGKYHTHLSFLKSLGVPLLMPFLAQMYYHESKRELNKRGRLPISLLYI